MLRPGIPIAVAAVALLLAAPAAPALASSQVIVEWAAQTGPGARAEARADAGAAAIAGLGGRFQLLEVEAGASPRAALAALRADPAVAAAERDAVVAPNAIPDDPLFDQLWGLQRIEAPAAWERTVGTPATVVADLDSGYRFEHPDLAAVAWNNPGEVAGNDIDDDANGYADDVHGYDFIGADGEAPAPDSDPSDDDLISGGHGVHTAGTIGAAGDDGVGITGVAQDARIMPLRVCSRFAAEDENLCRFSAMIGAINYAAANGARVANMSIGDTVDSTILRDAIAATPQVLFVISAGNDGEDNDSIPHYPCNFNPVAEGKSTVDNVICVAATDRADGLAGFSDWGASTVDLGAPGSEILSTYPERRLITEDFEADDFAARWQATGPDGGFARTDEAPLGSFGMSDSPGAAPAADSVRASRSAPVSLPAGFEDCTLEQSRTVSLGGGEYRYEVLLDGVPVATATPFTSGHFELDLEDDLAAGGEVSVRFRYAAGPAPGSGDGVWLDEIQLHCVEPVGQASGYELLEGTSMAAPHVSGTAALLFSLQPQASVSEVKQALLAGADPVPALAGKTVTGGRLDAAAALAALVPPTPPAPLLSATDPSSPANENEPRILGSAEAGTTVDLFAGDSCAGAPIASGSAAELEAPGIAVAVPDNSSSEFTAKASAGPASSECSAPIAYTEESPPPPGPVGPSSVVVTPPPELLQPPTAPAPPPAPTPGCTVPKLAGKTLAQAKSALAAASCALGAVRKPKAHRGRPLPRLVVRSSTPAAGALASGPVALTLGPKPKAAKARR